MSDNPRYSTYNPIVDKVCLVCNYPKGSNNECPQCLIMDRINTDKELLKIKAKLHAIFTIIWDYQQSKIISYEALKDIEKIIKE